MKAVVCESYGAPNSLVVKDVDPVSPSRGQVRVSVRAAGVNFPDALMVRGLYQFKPPFPFSPGMEISGVVEELGEGVEDFAVGDRVAATLPWGGFAEEVVVDAIQLMRVPQGMSPEVAAAFVLTYATSHYALKTRAQLKEGEQLLVLGASGGVGLSAVQLGKAMGARVIAAASTAEKLELCKAHGADAVINYAEEDLKKRAKELSGGGVDVIYDPVGGDYAEPALRAIGWEGRYLVIGFAAGDIPKIPLNLILLKSCQVVGVFWGSFVAREIDQHKANVAELSQMILSGKLKPHISLSLPLQEAAQALEALEARKVQGKAVLVLSEDW